MELKIGEIFNFHGIILQVCEVKDSARCKGCFFKNYPLSLCPPHTCVAIGRKDRKDIIFKKLINKMTREEVKELLPIMQAFAEGKTIEFSNQGGAWRKTDYPIWTSNGRYRIKPESKYRPFKTQEECWNEMLKHQPFGWVKAPNGELFCVHSVFNEGTTYRHGSYRFKEYFIGNYTFADGTPFGIIEE